MSHLSLLQSSLVKSFSMFPQSNKMSIVFYTRTMHILSAKCQANCISAALNKVFGMTPRENKLMLSENVSKSLQAQ